MKKVFKIGFLIIIVLYLLLFFAYENGYYYDLNKERRILTDEKIKEYESDLASGVDVSQKEYVIVKDSYDNTYTRFTLKLSKKIENGLSNVIKTFFRKISKFIDE